MEESTTENLVQPLSRRDFIKLIAGAGLGFGIAMTGLDKFAFLSNSGNNRNSAKGGGFGLFNDASAVPANGEWQTQYPTDPVAIHVAYLSNYKIVVVEGSSFNKSFGDQPPVGTDLRYSVYDPTNGVNPAVVMGETGGTNPPDLFCSHQAQLPDGNVLFVGGTKAYQFQTDPLNCGGNWQGSKQVFKFKVDTGLMEPMPSMVEGRWYPTLVCLPNGNVAVFAGDDSWGNNHENRIVQIWDWSNNTWLPAPLNGSNPQTSYAAGPSSGCSGSTITYNSNVIALTPAGIGEYPRMHLIHTTSGGYLIAVTGQAAQLRTWNPVSGLWTAPTASGAQLARKYGSSFLLPLENNFSQPAKILVTAGEISGSVSGNTSILTFTSATSVQNSPEPGLTHPRIYASPVILPDGKCVIFGGSSGGTGGPSVPYPEWIDPANPDAGWHDYANATVTRAYHSVALLLADGRVWNAGGTPSTPGTKTVQFFKPYYYDAPNKPTITSVANITGYGGTLKINTPDALTIDANPRGISLVKLGAITHHDEPNQRLIWLGIDDTTRTSNNGGSLTAYMPVSDILAPRGYYMIHVLKGGIPSYAKIIPIPGAADQTTPVLSVVTPSAGEVRSGPSNGFQIAVTGNASDGVGGSGINRVEVKIGTSIVVLASTTSGFATWTANVQAVSQGPTTIQVVAYDNNLNTSSITIPIRVAFN